MLARQTEFPLVVREADGDHFVILADEKKVAGATRPVGETYFRLEKKLAEATTEVDAAAMLGNYAEGLFYFD